MNTKKVLKLLLFSIVVSTGLLVIIYFLPNNSMWMPLISTGFIIFSLSSVVELVVLVILYFFKRSGYDWKTGKKRQRTEPPYCKSNPNKQFDYKVLIKLASLLSDNDSFVMNEIKTSISDYDNYALNHDLEDYIENKPLFCCLNMLTVLIDKEYIAGIDWKWEYDELVYSLNGANNRHNLSINFNAIGMLPDDGNTVFTDENLVIAHNVLRKLNYYLIDVDRDGDCYDLSIISESVYKQIMRLDLDSLGGYLKINLLNKL